MAKDLANPLQSLIAQAARAIPAETGESARYRARADSAGSGVVVLADLSSSMAESAGSRTRAAVLREALEALWPGLGPARIVGFGSTARELPGPGSLPGPAGGTALHLALDLATTLAPARTLVLSDGQPDDEAAALATADRLPGRIDVVFCGPDSDAVGRDFLARLARAGCGTFVRCDLSRGATAPQLAIAARRALGLPSPGGA